jgi:hypothetical protein
MTASLNNKRPLFSLVATDPHSMFRSRGALISIAAAALVLASTRLISRPANQSSTELPKSATCWVRCRKCWWQPLKALLAQR